MNICRNCKQLIEEKNCFPVSELQLGLREKFTYSECSHCGCLSLQNDIQDFGRYYDNATYYSYGDKKNIFQKAINFVGGVKLFHSLKATLIGAKHVDHKSLLIKLIKQYTPNKSCRILDVGCGGGAFLYDLHAIGYTQLFGVDPFLDTPIQNKKITIDNTDIFEFQPNQKFDIINMSHVIEHTENHDKILKRLHELLNDNGILLISQPIKSQAFETYKEYWYQIDAPRHLIVHTLKSFTQLVNNSPLTLQEIIFDSTFNQCTLSEYYKNGIGIADLKKYPFKVIYAPLKHYILADFYNKKQLGDQAVFVIKKGNESK